ncbi:MAG: 3,4-dihydroxy-2-butanone-4-phosphate synthase [candidate division WS1 bacterium]|nr:3,4-dihydroxy-2-butanone-4-phosphate synthase [candidate division WS1 bacterium]
MSTIEEAIEALRSGGFVALEDHPERENEADVLLAGELATGASVNFLAVHARGLITVAVAPEILERLDIPLLPQRYTVANAPRFTEPVDAVEGTTTGASAFDRAITLNKLADPNSRPEDFSRPGHVFPLQCMPGCLLDRRGHTEGAIALAKLAGLQPVVAICELMNEEGHMARGEQVVEFAEKHGMPRISVQALVKRTCG